MSTVRVRGADANISRDLPPKILSAKLLQIVAKFICLLTFTNDVFTARLGCSQA